MAPYKISVIVPIYNAEHYLDATLVSIEKQTLSEIEIICIDDCSTDTSLSVLYKHKEKDSRIKIIRHSANCGTGATINDGLNAAQGLFVQIVGNDDLLEPYALHRLYTVCTDLNLDFIQYGINVIVDDPSNPSLVERSHAQIDYHAIKQQYPISRGLEILDLAVRNKEYRMSNGPQLIRRSLLEDNHIRNLEGIKHEDMYFTYRVFLASQRCTLIPDPLYSYRIRQGSQEDSKKDQIFTSSEVYSLLRSAAQMAKETPDEIYFDPAYQKTMNHTINRFYSLYAKRYIKMMPSEREKFNIQSSKIEMASFLTLNSVTSYLEKKAQSEISKVENQITKIKNSYSYRLGHALLAPFYRIIKLARLLKEKRQRL